MGKRTLILIATYNEAENIERLVKETLSLEDAFDILLVDDNSPDGTGQIIKGLYGNDSRVKVVIREGEKGRGLAAIAGYGYFSSSGYDYLCELDADFQEDPRDISKLVQEAERTNCDIVIGSRYIKGGGFKSRKKLLSLLTRFLMSLLFRAKTKDVTNWFHLIKRDVFLRIDYNALQSRGFFLAAELHLLAERTGLNLKEVAIFFPSRAKGKTKIDLRVVADFAKDVLSFKVRGWRRK
jgi:dolichol-phosphate mannosyltransferase